MKRFFVILLSALSALNAAAQTASALLIVPDPVAYGRGGAVVAAGADAFAVDNDAAAMSLSEDTFDVSVIYGRWSPKGVDNTVLGLGAYYRINDKFALGLSGRKLQDQPYEITSASGQVTGSFTPGDFVAGLGLSYACTDELSLGLTGRFLSSKIGVDASGRTFAADVTAMYAKDAFSAALGVCNIGAPLSYGGAKSSLPMLAKAGAAYSVGGFTASAEADYLFSGVLMAGLGLEYTIAEIVSLRGGFHYGNAAEAVSTYASLGLGLQYAGVHFDAAFLLASKTLGNTLMFGLGYAF